jgi:adenosylcobinamide-GDP ribazoletransferase
MNRSFLLKRPLDDFYAAVQFLTRVPISPEKYEPDTLSRSIKYFPAVGLLIGASAALIQMLVARHFPRNVTALVVLSFLVLVTGCLHEDGLADAADGLGGGWNRDQSLLIMRDSRIGSYGATTLVLSLLLRCTLIASLPLGHVWQYLIAAHVLCRWTTLPLSYLLPPARQGKSDVTDGQGARLAGQTTRRSLIISTLFMLFVVSMLLRMHAILLISVSVLVTWASGYYYWRRIGGVTGDCFGATNQLTEIAVYLCGAWLA